MKNKKQLERLKQIQKDIERLTRERKETQNDNIINNCNLILTNLYDEKYKLLKKIYK